MMLIKRHVELSVNNKWEQKEIRHIIGVIKGKEEPGAIFINTFKLKMY